MPPVKSKTIFVSLVIVIIATTAIAASYFIFFKKTDKLAAPAAETEITAEAEAEMNFNKTGTLSQAEPETNPDAWYLISEEPGGPALATELAFDDESICSYGWDGVISCADLSFDEGEQVQVKGTVAEGVALVKILTAYVTKGVSWEEAVQWVKDCRAKEVNQTHAREVIIRLQNDTEVWTEEPALDDVIKVAEAVEATCGKIPMGTE